MTAFMAENGYINNVISEIYFKFNILNKSNSEISFNISSSIKIIEKAIKILQYEQSVLQINTIMDKKDVVIVGDIHGNIESLINIFQSNGDPTTTKYIFLGDYVDRGNNSIEVIILLYAFKCLYPDNIFLIRGNHEFRDMNDNYGLKNECFKRINNTDKINARTFYNKITGSFQYLPICAILNDKIFCVHGGISALIENREELLNIKKVGIQYTRNDSIQAEFLWNDPDHFVDTYERSSRGIGCIFGSEALNDFLEKMDFNYVIRAHQCQSNGFDWAFGKEGGILTVFSSFDYCGSSNDGAVAIVSYDNKIKTSVFDMKPSVFIPEKIIQNNFALMNVVIYNQELNIVNMTVFV